MDWQKISARLLNWGTPLLVAGALVCFLSRKLTARVPERSREKADAAVKLAGLALAVVGALRVLSFI
ncbi:MAG: hypothetical protein IKS31_11645 [Clostridia bacterium]|nr:hypothetical protein [Clostridia bacterium]MBR4459601.1 hypothetical protein [Clostridia bacterium]